MPGSWAGSYTMELVASTPHAAADGHRGVVDLDVLGSVTILAPAPTTNGSFSVWWANQNRNTLTIDGNGNPIQDLGGPAAASVSTTLKDGVAGFVWDGVAWLVSDFITFETPLGVQAGVTFTGRATNGLCVLEDAYRIASVERTAQGDYTVTSDGTDISNMVISVPQPYAISLPANQAAECHVRAKTTTTIDLEVGVRNSGGVFQGDDLVQDAANRISLFVVRLA